MAKKATKRERKEEARRRRLEEMRRRQRRTQLRKLYTWGALAAAVALIVVWVVLARSGSNKARATSAKIAKAAGCAEPRSFPIEGREHVAPPQRVTYGTNPPTSGNHYSAPTQTGIHAQPVQDEQAVHNLEHGHVEIFYTPGQLSPAALTALEQFVRQDAAHRLILPRPNTPAPVAFAAWGESQVCAAPTDKIVDAARDFARRFGGRGPESIPGTPVFETAAPSPPSSPLPTGAASPSPSGSPSPSPSPSSSPSPSPTPSPTATQT